MNTILWCSYKGVCIIKKINLLTIDDNKMFAQVLKEYLETKTSIDTITMASDGEEGLKCIKSIGIDNLSIILLDLYMDGMDGFDFIQEFKKLYGKENMKKIQVITAYKISEIGNVIKNLGLVASPLIKPIDMKNIADRIIYLTSGTYDLVIK